MDTRRRLVRRLALLGLIVVLLLAFPIGPQLEEVARRGEIDFLAFYTAGQIVARGQGEQLYDFETQARLQKELVGRGYPLPFYHPPFEALLFVPLAWLPYPAAYMTWGAANLLMLWLLALWLGPYFRPLPPAWRFTLLLSAAVPIGLTILQGQDVLLLLLLFVLAFAALKGNAEFRAGCFLALGQFKFQLVWPLALLFVVRRNTKLLAGFAATSLALLIASCLIVGLEGLWSYPRLLWELNQALENRLQQDERAIYPADMPNLRGLVWALAGNALPAGAFHLLVALLSLGLVVWTNRQWGEATPREVPAFDLQFSLALVLTLLISYHAHLHDFSLLVLPAVLLLAHLNADDDARKMRRGRGLCVLLLLLVPLSLLLLQWRQLYLLSLGLLGLAWLAATELGRSRADSTNQPFND
jgi:hypothetical protein